MPIANGTGFVGEDELQGANQGTIAREQQDLGGDMSAQLDPAIQKAKDSIDAAAKDTPEALNAQASLDSGNDNDLAFKNWENAQAKAKRTGGEVSTGKNPYDTTGGTLRDYSMLKGSDQAMQDVNAAKSLEGQAQNLGTWGGTFDALKQKYGGTADQNAFDANLLGASFSDAANKAKAATNNLDDYWNNAVTAAAKTPYDTYNGEYTPSTTPNTGTRAEGQAPGNLGPGVTGQAKGTQGPAPQPPTPATTDANGNPVKSSRKYKGREP